MPACCSRLAQCWPSSRSGARIKRIIGTTNGRKTSCIIKADASGCPAMAPWPRGLVELDPRPADHLGPQGHLAFDQGLLVGRTGRLQQQAFLGVALAELRVVERLGQHGL